MIEVRKADGTAYRNWTRVSLTASLDDAARSFSLEVFPPDGATALDLIGGDPVEIWVHDTPVITGFVESVAPRTDQNGYRLTYVGRSATADFVDSSAPTKALRGLTLRRLAETLAAPYGIEVVDFIGDATILPRTRPDATDTCLDVLHTHAEVAGALVTDDEAGRLVLMRGDAVTELSPTRIVYGENVIESDGEFSLADRFSQYEVRGQSITETDVIADARGFARDYGVQRRRRKTIAPKRHLTPDDARKLARWEALHRIGLGQRMTYTLPGWVQANGEPWRPGLLVEIDDPTARLDKVRWIVAGMDLQRSAESGDRAVLTTRPVEAYLAPLRPKPGRGTGYWLTRKGDTLEYTGGAGGTIAVPPAGADDPGAFPEGP